MFKPGGRCIRPGTPGGDAFSLRLYWWVRDLFFFVIALTFFTGISAFDGDGSQEHLIPAAATYRRTRNLVLAPEEQKQWNKTGIRLFVSVFK